MIKSRNVDYYTAVERRYRQALERHDTILVCVLKGGEQVWLEYGLLHHCNISATHNPKCVKSQIIPLIHVPYLLCLVFAHVSSLKFSCLRIR